MEQDDSKVEGGNGGRGRAGGRRRVGAGLGRRGKGGGSGRHGGRPRPGLPPPGSAAAGASQVETPRRRSSGSSAPLGSGFKVGPFTRCFPRSSGGDGGGRVSGGGRAGGRPAEGAEREGAINEGKGTGCRPPGRWPVSFQATAAATTPVPVAWPGRRKRTAVVSSRPHTDDPLIATQARNAITKREAL
ncbi:uncharacterized protein LOC101756916 [Setaria italica]|uniref:uncharacterized protein LOC101756916 n=1 Tax=Setaria italica TaxID=4555 RepID=UPI0003513F05|nr:uncharacterized protein LOC101756916 [Setaria italica]